MPRLSIQDLLGEFDRGEITEQFLSHLLALYYWDNIELGLKP